MTESKKIECPKCGSLKLSATYRRPIKPVKLFGFTLTRGRKEHLEIYCWGCSYCWPAAVGSARVTK